jgi:phosphotransferase system enzyme I (PtsI)
LGFASELGGKTSHVSILARSMGLPAVVGIERLMKKVQDGKTMIVDGNTGIVCIDPHQHILKSYEKRKKQFSEYWKRLSKEVRLPAVTIDHEAISLQANVSMIADVSLAVQYAADGIGLFRTELPFLTAGKLLSENEQFDIYRTIVEAMKGKTVTIRTLDLGGDKFLPFQGVEKESNPFMGWRSIRIFLQEKDVFKAQLRAILKASHYGKVQILYPMISSLEEISEIQKIMEQTQKELKKENVPFDESIRSGIMVEVPSMAVMAERTIHYTDFFSIGTNDLIQYTLAVDRNNEKVAKFYQPLNPAIVQLLYTTIQAALKAKKNVSICGEMAGNPLYTGMLLGFGLRQFSMSPLMIPEIKERVRAMAIEECEEIASKILDMNSTEAIEKLLWTFHEKVNKRQSIPYFEKLNVQVSEEALDQYLQDP